MATHTPSDASSPPSHAIPDPPSTILTLLSPTPRLRTPILVINAETKLQVEQSPLATLLAKDTPDWDPYSDPYFDPAAPSHSGTHQHVPAPPPPPTGLHHIDWPVVPVATHTPVAARPSMAPDYPVMNVWSEADIPPQYRPSEPGILGEKWFVGLGMMGGMMVLGVVCVWVIGWCR
ncbi:hypothetical protein BS50DRAFT_592262 [Corynespora cassiicola Philippines]|uniref:Uncharacterized protein n=1 Tax=Corynespora cassiicola Philippines TaxID=1448308 RepID=A0A2T2N9W0_CORCC|nr:hypothetical protein BS50DRAFT_592262 [Corynespora cassiicola Philippines]